MAVDPLIVTEYLGLISTRDTQIVDEGKPSFAGSSKNSLKSLYL